MSDQITILDGQIESTRKAAIAMATKAKEIRARLKERFLASSTDGADKQARALHGQLAELSADQAFEEEHLAALHERRAQIAAETEAARAKAERAAKVDAFKALIAKRGAAATVAEKAITRLGEAVRDISALTADIQNASPSVGLPRNAVDDPAGIRYGVEFSLYQAGLQWMYAEKPLARYDAQGKPTATISARLKRDGDALVAMLPKED